ncbi:MAG: ATP-binding protein, partial [Chthoniobacterales bacterium]
PGNIKRLFTDFEQIETTASQAQNGTGLGLALTRRIVDLQGGSIDVESKIGKGSTFTVILPLVMKGAKV